MREGNAARSGRRTIFRRRCVRGRKRPRRRTAWPAPAGSRRRLDYNAHHADQVDAARALALRPAPPHPRNGRGTAPRCSNSARCFTTSAIHHHKSHHRHGEYLIRNGEIPGLRGWRRDMVGALVRYHNMQIRAADRSRFLRGARWRTPPPGRACSRRCCGSPKNSNPNMRSAILGVDVQIAGRKAIFLIRATEGTRLDLAGLQRKAGTFRKGISPQTGIPPRSKKRESEGGLSMILYLVRHGHRSRPHRPEISCRSRTPAHRERRAKNTRRRARPSRAGRQARCADHEPLRPRRANRGNFRGALGSSVQKIRVSESLKPAANPAEIVKEITRLRAKEVMVFGHAPHLDVLAAHLIGTRVFTEIKKAGVACFEHASAAGKWDLRWLVTPKMLREIGD